MHHSIARVACLLLAPAVLLCAQAPAKRKWLEPTSHYLDAAKADFSALPEPPRPGSLAAAADLEAILQIQAWRTEAQVAYARRVDHLDAFEAAEAIGPWFTRADLPRCAQFMEEVLGDGEAMNYVAKLKYKRLRPPFVDPRVQPCVPFHKSTADPLPPSYYSYPSGHATSIFLLGEVLGDLLPERREAIQVWAHKAAWSRMIAGVHFPTDDMGGRLLAGITARTMRANPAYQAALEKCREEVRALMARKAA